MNVVHPYTGLSLSFEREGDSDTACYNTEAIIHSGTGPAQHGRQGPFRSSSARIIPAESAESAWTKTMHLPIPAAITGTGRS